MADKKKQKKESLAAKLEALAIQVAALVQTLNEEDQKRFAETYAALKGQPKE